MEEKQLKCIHSIHSMQKLYAEIKSRNSCRKAKTFYLLLIDGARINMLQRQKNKLIGETEIGIILKMHMLLHAFKCRHRRTHSPFESLDLVSMHFTMYMFFWHNCVHTTHILRFIHKILTITSRRSVRDNIMQCNMKRYKNQRRNHGLARRNITFPFVRSIVHLRCTYIECNMLWFIGLFKKEN